MEKFNKEYKDFSTLDNSLFSGENKTMIKNHVKTKILKNICAFSNSGGGSLIIGYEDQTGKAKEQPNYVKELLSDPSKIDDIINQYLSQNIRVIIKPHKNFPDNKKNINKQINISSPIEIVVFPATRNMCSFQSEIVSFKNPHDSKSSKEHIFKGEIYKRIESISRKLTPAESIRYNKEFRQNNIDYDPYPWLSTANQYSHYEVNDFLIKNLFYKHSSFIDINNEINLVKNSTLELKMIEYSILKSIYGLKNNSKDINWDLLTDRLNNIWQNNILIQNINLLGENIKYFDIKRIFIEFEKSFNNSSFIQMTDKNNKKMDLDFSSLFIIWEYIDPENYFNNKTLYSMSKIKENPIHSPYDKNFNDIDMEDNIHVLNSIFKLGIWAPEESDLRNLDENISSLELWCEKNLGYEFVSCDYDALKDLRKLNIDLWYYFIHAEKRSLKKTMIDSENILNKYSNMSDEKKMIIKIYFSIKKYFNQDLENFSNGGTTTESGWGINLFKDKKFILYLEKINDLRTSFLKSIIMPLSKSLNIFDQKSETEKLITKIIFNHLIIIQANLDLTLFYIPHTYRYKDSFDTGLKNAYIQEVIISKVIRWTKNTDVDTGVHFLDDNLFKINGVDFNDKRWLKEVIIILQNMKEEICIQGNEIRLSNKDYITWDNKMTKEEQENNWNSWMTIIKEEWLDIINILSDKEVKKALKSLLFKK